MPTHPKLCIDCKHCQKGELLYFCHAPESAVPSIVTGEKSPMDCENARTWHLCGPDAKFWEPKEGAK